ncbi:MAG: hypothetical protein IPQ24_07330 [Anaeromyxobacter sp.]|nr:hypothetical protein [Anaeromyxobacter sp.]
MAPTVIHLTVGMGGASRTKAPRSLMYWAWFMPRLSPEVSATPGLRSPFSHQSCQIMPQRLCSRTPALTLGPTRPLMVSSNSVQAPLEPPMLSTQNGLDSDRQPWLASFLYMYFV